MRSPCANKVRIPTNIGAIYRTAGQGIFFGRLNQKWACPPFGGSQIKERLNFSEAALVLQAPLATGPLAAAALRSS